MVIFNSYVKLPEGNRKKQIQQVRLDPITIRDIIKTASQGAKEGIRQSRFCIGTANGKQLASTSINDLASAPINYEHDWPILSSLVRG